MVEEAKRYNLDIIGVSSTKRLGSGAVDLGGGWKLFYSGADARMSLKRVWGFSQAPVVRLCLRLYSFGITGLHVEAQGIGSVIVPIAGICPQAACEYQAFVDEVNDGLLRVSPTESTVLMGDLNAHVGADTDTRKGVIGKHGVTGLNENGRYLLQLRCSNGLRIMNTFFQHRENHKYTWYRPSMDQNF